MEKENSIFSNNQPQEKKYQKVKNQNDYIFKRYRYQKNNIFKDYSNQQVAHQKQNQSNQKKQQKPKFQPEIIQFEDDIQDPFHIEQEELQKFPGEQNEFKRANQNVIKQPINIIENFTTQKTHADIIEFDDNQDQDNQYQFQQPSQFQFQGKVKNTLKNQFIQHDAQFPISPHSPHQLRSLNQTLYSQVCLQETATSLIRKPNIVPQIKNKNNQQRNQQNKNTSQNVQNFRNFQEQQDQSQQFQNQNLKGVKISSKAFEDDTVIQITDKRLFSISKIPPGIILKCKLKRQYTFFSALSNQYDLYLQNGLKHIISAKKYPFRNRQLFKFSNSIGKFQGQVQRSLMANLSHNGYWLVDQPREIQSKKISYLDILVLYQKIENNQKDRQMRVFIPPSLKSYHIGLQFDTPQLNFDWFKKQISLQLTNKLITKNYEFKMASQKNFVLVDDQDDDYFYLKVQKSSQDIFDVQIQHPLTPMQAMAIIMTRFDAQLK